MNRSSLIILAAALAGLLQAQTGAPSLANEARQGYNNEKNYILRAAEKMPAEDYSFKPTPEIRNFGQLLTHVADTQMLICGLAKGEKQAPNAASKTAKADIIPALKASFDYCDPLYTALTDANASDAVDFFRGKRTRVGLLDFNTTHNNEMYGVMGVYLRLKGIVPPSSEPQGQNKK